MKKLICLMAVMAVALLISGLAIADDNDEEDLNKDIQSTGRGIYTTPIDPLTDWLNNNDYIMHGHEIFLPTRREVCAGPGWDFILFETQSPWLERITAETKYDFQNDEGSVYVVGTTNVFRAVTGMFR